MCIKKYFFKIFLILLFFFLLFFNIRNFSSFSFLEILMKDSIYKLIYNSPDNTSFSYDLSYDNLKYENKKLKELLNLGNTLSDFNLINACVVSVNPNYLFGEFTINRGSNDGVEPHMAVINSSGLVGVVTKVSKSYSVVSTLNRYDDKISVKITTGDSFVYGVFSSDGSNFYVDGISSNAEILDGAVVYTSGLSDVFPDGIEVGSVYNIDTDNFELSRILYVKSNVDFNDLGFVSVVRVDAHD